MFNDVIKKSKCHNDAIKRSENLNDLSKDQSVSMIASTKENLPHIISFLDHSLQKNNKSQADRKEKQKAKINGTKKRRLNLDAKSRM